MKMIDAIQGFNPVETAIALVKKFEEMSEAEFRTAQKTFLARAQRFAESGDKNFSASLDEAEAVSYAATCNEFAKALQKSKQKKDEMKPIAAPALANAIAWWHLLENARDVSDE